MTDKVALPPKGIEIKPEVRFGIPVIKGTRVAVVDLLNLVEAGYAVGEIPQQYPTVSLAAVKTAIRYAANILGKEEVLLVSG